MHTRPMVAIALLVAVVALAACQSSTGFGVDGSRLGTAQSSARADSGFELDLLPETLNGIGLAGASAEFSLDCTTVDDLRAVSVRASNANELKGLLCGLRFDSERFTFVRAMCSPALSELGPTISLDHLDEHGVVWHGELLTRAQEMQGLNGDAVLYTAYFKPGAGSLARPVAAAPISERSRATLTLNAGILGWGYYHQGDYDQNTETNISDLAPLAANFQASSGGGEFPAGGVLSVVDGDGNGEINISDLTPISANFGRVVTGYNVYESLSPGTDYPLTNGAASSLASIGSVSMDLASGSRTTQRLQLSFTLTSPQAGASYWVRPTDGTTEGTPSTQAALDNLPPVINSLSGNPLTVDSGDSSALTVDATDPDGDALTYVWTAQSGNIAGTGASVTFNAPVVVTNSQVTVSLEVQDGRGGVAPGEVVFTVIAPEQNLPPVINSIICTPDPLPSTDDGILSADVTDPNGDALTYDWQVSLGSVALNGDNTGTWTPSAILVDTTATITLTVDDGNGGSDTQSVDVLVQYVPEDLDHIELNDPDVLGGSGTLADPYLIDGDPGSELEVQLKAVGVFGTDMTSICAWAEASSSPGTGFSGTQLGLLFVSPFDSDFSVTASFGIITSAEIYFRVVPPG